MLNGETDSQGEGANVGENVAMHFKVIGHYMVSCAKMAELIDMPFWVAVGPGNHVLDGDGAYPPTGVGNFRGLSGPFRSIRNLRCSRRCCVFAAKGIFNCQ